MPNISSLPSSAARALLPCAVGAVGDDAILAPGSVLLRQVGTGHWFPAAKGFGQLLNLNCAVMLLPVVRSGVKWLHDATSIKARWCAIPPYAAHGTSESGRARATCTVHQCGGRPLRTPERAQALPAPPAAAAPP